MTAHEEQDERVVLVHPALDASLADARSEVVDRRRFGRDLRDDDGLAAAPRQLGAHVIGHAPRRDVDQPAARVVGHALLGPLQGRREERFLHRVLGGGKVAEAPDHRAENLRRELAQQVLAGRVQRLERHMSTGGALITSRTSIGMFSGTPPLPGAADARAAISYARSLLSQSTIQKPARNSFASG